MSIPLSVRANLTHQLGWTRLKEDGQCIGYTSHTVHQAQQDNIIFSKRRSWICEEKEHREINHRLDHSIKVVNGVFGQKVSQAAHARCTLSPIL